MKRAIIRIGEITIVLAVVVIASYLALRPEPIRVETGRVSRGSMSVTVDGEGKTRVHDRFTVAAPVTGKLTRIRLERGDAIAPGGLIARIDPLPLAPLDPRQRTEAEARVRSAEAVRREAEANVGLVSAHLDQATRDRKRTEELLEAGVVSRQEYERAKEYETACAQDLKAARFKVQAAAQEVEVARSALLTANVARSSVQPSVPVTSPTGGRVLRVLEENERVVQAGTPLIEVSNPSALEIVVDVLSSDAVKIKPGAAIAIHNWGGASPLEARVRYVEPSGFTKVSALGIEEQRVNVIADFTGSSGGLGDGFRVEARIVIWSAEQTLKVPASALFRTGSAWTVFVVQNGAARRREVEVGHRTDFEVEIVHGLAEQDQVILHPANEIADGAKVTTP